MGRGIIYFPDSGRRKGAKTANFCIIVRLPCCMLLNQATYVLWYPSRLVYVWNRCNNIVTNTSTVSSTNRMVDAFGAVNGYKMETFLAQILSWRVPLRDVPGGVAQELTKKERPASDEASDNVHTDYHTYTYHTYSYSYIPKIYWYKVPGTRPGCKYSKYIGHFWCKWSHSGRPCLCNFLTKGCWTNLGRRNNKWVRKKKRKKREKNVQVPIVPVRVHVVQPISTWYEVLLTLQ